MQGQISSIHCAGTLGSGIGAPQGKLRLPLRLRGAINPGVAGRNRAARLGFLTLAVAMVCTTAQMRAAQLTLTWTDNADNESGFKLERSTNGTSFSQTVALGANVTTYADTSLANGTTYWYRIRAYNSNGDSGYSDVASATAPALANTAPTISNITNRTINEDAGSGAIAFTIGDVETAAGSLVVSGSSSNTTLVPNSGIVFGGSGGNRTVSVIPASERSGSASIAVTVSDGTLSATTYFVVTVNPVNDMPAITAIADQTIVDAPDSGEIAFTVGDAETAASNLTLSASSSNTSLLPASSIFFSGNGANRTVRVAPVANRAGQVLVTVRVSDGLLSATEEFVVTVERTIANAPELPVIVSQPAGASAMIGGAATFAVTATGNPAPTYQWRLNGTDISGAKAATYSINPVQTGHAGSYSVVVSNTAGSVTSANASLTVTSPLAITKQPQSQVVSQWSAATMSVTATGSSLTYQWYAGQSGDLSRPIAGSTSASYTTATLSVESSFWVRVASGNAAVNSNSASVAMEKRERFFSGNFGPGGVSAFAMHVSAKGLARMLASLPDGQSFIDAAGIVIEQDGGFSFEAKGVGTITGQLADGGVLGVLEATGMVFSGTEDNPAGPTARFAGTYEGVVLNRSDGEVVVLAGPAGRAFVLVRLGSTVHGGVVDIAADGSLVLDLGDGQVLELLIDEVQKRVSGTLHSFGQTMVVSGVPETVSTPRKLSNTSIRARVGQGSELMVAGFVIAGEGTKSVLVRAVGPTLAGLGVAGALSDPVISVFREGDPAGAPAVGGNDNWTDSPQAVEIAEAAVRLGAFELPSGSGDGAVLLALPAGGYTAHVAGKSGGTGAAIVEIYDADDPDGPPASTRLANISMRGVAGGGGDTVVAGFVVSGTVPKKVLMRAVGPELTEFGVIGVLGDPNLTVYHSEDEQETVIASNNDWAADAGVISTAGDAVGAFSLTTDSKSAALVLWLAPGVYTAQASAGSGPSSIALVEVYELE